MSRICLVFVTQFLLLAGCLLAVVLFAKPHRDIAQLLPGLFSGV
jgi:hypothetical protein